jgi:hypothetical protein
VIRLFKNYVEHARKIHNKGNPYQYRRAIRLEALSKCETHYAYFKNLSPLAACRIIPKLENYLLEILPIKSNNSYEGSLKRLEYLLQLCNSINKSYEVRANGDQHHDRKVHA